MSNYHDGGLNDMIETSVSSSTVTRGPTARSIARDVIAATAQQQNYISGIYRDTLQSIKTIFSGLKYVNADNGVVTVRCIHGNPERTIAKLKQDNNIILPIISVVQSSSEEDNDRRRPHEMLLLSKVWVESKQRSYRVLRSAPKAVNLLYDVNVWSKYKSDLDQLSEQIHLKFHPAINVVTPNNKETLGFLSQETDQSSVDLGDKEDRILRRSYSFKVQTYIESPSFLFSTAGKVESFNTQAELTDLIE